MTVNSQNLDGPPLRASVAETHRKAIILLVAMTGAIVIYVALGLVFLNTRDPAPRPLQARIPFYVIALFMALGSISFRRTQLRWLRLEAVGGLRGPEGLIRHFFNTALVSAALAEVVGLLALIIVFFGGETRDVLSLGIVALLIILTSYPRRSAWEKAVEYFAANAPGASVK